LEFLRSVDWPAALLWLGCVVGLVGTLVPMFPGSLLIVLSAVGFTLWQGTERLGYGALGLVGGLFVAAQVAQYLVSAYGAKRMGASRWGTVGAALGLMLGVFLPVPPVPVGGALTGAFLGALGLELLGARRRGEEAFGAGVGAALGALASLFAEFLFGVAMLVVLFLSLR
jgi:uncharacterized protein YqgC (DUF456 family)